MRNTRSSRAISSDMAWVIASRYVVSGIPVSIPGKYAQRRVRWIRHWRRIRFVRRRIDLAPHALLDRVDVVLRGEAVVEQQPFESRDRILRLPLLDQFLRHVRLVVVLGVPFDAERLDLQQRDAAPVARAFDRLLRRAVDREYVVAVDRVAGAAEGDRLV